MKNRVKNKHDIDSSKSPSLIDLKAASKLANDDLLKTLDITLAGNTESKALQMRIKFGRNIISHEKPDSAFSRLIKSFVNPFNIVLFVLVLISLVTDVIYAKQKSF